MSLFNEKVKLNKVLWKELIIGAVEGFVWCTILFLIVYGYNEEMIDLLNFLNDNVDKVFSLYFCMLAIFVVIAVLIKLGFFVLRFEAPVKAVKRTKHVEAPKATTVKKAPAKKHVAKPAAKVTTAKKTTTKKKTTKK